MARANGRRDIGGSGKMKPEVDKKQQRSVKMPRQARKKVMSEESFYHYYNRIVGSSGDYPFTEEEKSMGFRILQKCLQFLSARTHQCNLYGKSLSYHHLSEQPFQRALQRSNSQAL
jgi:hypothetical protein